MASKIKRVITFIVVIAVIILGCIAVKPFYIVNEGEQVVVKRLSRIVSTQTEAGMYFKMPLIDIVTTYPKKILSLDGDTEEIQTKENLLIVVDITSRWQISNPEKFYQKFQTLDNGYKALSGIVDSACRTIITQNSLSEIVRSSNKINQVPEVEEGESISIEDSVRSASQNDVVKLGRTALCLQMVEEANKNVSDWGITVIDIVPRQIKYSDKLTESVYSRMIKDRNQVARAYRSEGEGKKEELLGKLAKDKQTKTSEAYKRAEEIKGEGDAEAARIYAEAYSKDPEFFAFWKSMESYKKTLKDYNATYSTNMDYFDYLYGANGR